MLWKWPFVFEKCLPDYKSGFGGQFGVQTDRMDKSALGWDYYQQNQKHGSQTGKIPEKNAVFCTPTKIVTFFFKNKKKVIAWCFADASLVFGLKQSLIGIFD